jgi:hypothetical protein
MCAVSRKATLLSAPGGRSVLRLVYGHKKSPPMKIWRAFLRAKADYFSFISL